MDKKYSGLSITALSLVLAGVLSQLMLVSIRSFFVIFIGLIILIIGYFLCITDRSNNANLLNTLGIIIGTTTLILFLIIVITAIINIVVLSKSSFNIDNLLSQIIMIIIDILKH